jgi:hypothetical protein
MAESCFDILVALPKEVANQVLKHLSISDLAAAQQVDSQHRFQRNHPNFHHHACAL